MPNKNRISLRILFTKIPNTVKAVSCASFLINMSTLMIFSFFAIYLHTVLHIDLSKLGFLDGTVEAASYFMKLISGYTSDILRNRKVLFLFGTLLLFIAKPLEAFCTKFWPLFFSKVLERFGNGVQSTPRDTLISDWAPEEIRGICFGMRQSLAAFGSVVGALTAAFLYIKMRDFQKVFWCACIPAMCAVIIIALYVKNKESKPSIRKYKKISIREVTNLSRGYWILLIIASTYNIAKVSDSLLLLYITSHWKLDLYFAPLLLALTHLSNSFTSFYAGLFSDQIKHTRQIFIFGICIFILSDLLFIYGKNSLPITTTALLCVGSYSGITQSLFLAKVSEFLPEDLKGTGLGLYNLVCALSLLIGGILLGALADSFGFRMAFYVSVFLAIASLAVLLMSKLPDK